MTRDLKTLSAEPFDVLVIGGGAAGAAAAREASLRGLRTALIEREDFGGGTSAHCFKVVHGGIRYIQHADLRRLRLSCAERSALLRLAPHLVHPLPFAVPTYGYARSSKWFIGTGMLLYDALTLGRNRGLEDPSRRIRLTRFFGREETLRLFPLLQRKGLTGAAVFEDGQMHNPPRLVLAFVMAAQELGATVANYVEAERFLLEGNRVIGVS
ncbi:MAG TPA: FAD-dependent oxidoreductase, partial [Steroidobacteraceae bacterium]